MKLEIDPRIDRALASFDEEPIPEAPPESLPILDLLRGEKSEPDIFDRIDVLFVQHHLGPFKPRLVAMQHDGLDMSRSWFIDIPYSTCPSARDAAHEGCPAEQTVELFDDPFDPYAEVQLSRVLLLIRDLADRARQGRLLVVDDGAYFLRALHLLRKTKPRLAEAFTGTRVVEQTTRGHRVVARSADLIDALGFSVVSIARCQTKLFFESPFIGAAAARAIRRALQESSGLVDEFHRAGVIGFGPVGEAVTRALIKSYPELEVDVIEPSMDKHQRIIEAGARAFTEMPESVQDGMGYELIAGCTGYNSFKLHHRSLLANKAVLASGSSAAVEFNRAGFVELADAYPDDEIEVVDRDETRKKGIHATITLRHEGDRRMSFLNAGFPVNFDGRMECLPTRLIQPTHCLLFAASRQVLQASEPGVHRFDPLMDAWLLEASLDQLSQSEG